MLLNSKAVGLIGALLGSVALGYVVRLQVKVNKTEALLVECINEISKKVSIDVPDALIEEAITQTIEREIGTAIRKASSEAIGSARRDMRNEVKAAVEGSFSNIKTSVATEVSKQVADMDITALRNEVKLQAKELVVEKFQKDLDSVLEDFNQNLSNVSKIYGSIAESMTKKNSGPVFQIQG